MGARCKRARERETHERELARSLVAVVNLTFRIDGSGGRGVHASALSAPRFFSILPDILMSFAASHRRSPRGGSTVQSGDTGGREYLAHNGIKFVGLMTCDVDSMHYRDN